MEVAKRYEIDDGNDLRLLVNEIGGSNAKSTVSYLYDSELETIMVILEDECWSSGESFVDEDYLLDFLAYESDIIAEWLDFKSFDEIMKRGKVGNV